MNNICESIVSQIAERITSPEEITWECPACGIQKPHSYTMRGVTHYGKRKCACQKAEEERLEKEKQRLKTLEYYGNHTYNWLGDRWSETTLRKKTFENFQADRQLRAYKAAQIFRYRAIWGPCPTRDLWHWQNSSLAAICNETLVKYNRRSLFITATKLFAAIQYKIAHNEDYYAIIEKAIKTPLLVIDDIDKAKWTEWREEQYFAIIDERVKHELPTAISTNKVDELASFVGGAVCSRLQVGQIAIEMVGSDFRKEL